MLLNSSLETGIHVLDMQHRELFRQVDDVLLAADNKHRRTDILDFFEKYAIIHIRTEELMQERLNYPKIATHKKIHGDFIPMLQNLREEYEEQGCALFMLREITRTMFDWLKHHILTYDKDFAAYVKHSNRIS